METITRKRPGRPRKAVATPEIVGEVGDEPENPFGDWQVSEAGTGSPAILGAESKGASWADLTEALRMERRQVVRCWHPEEQDALFLLPNGVNVEVNKGSAAYQLSDGSIETDI